MSTSSRMLALLPLLAIAGLAAAGSFAVASPKLDGTLDQARELAIDAVHQGASTIAEKTRGPQAGQQRVRGERPVPRTGPPPRPQAPSPRPASQPASVLDGQQAADVGAVHADVKERFRSAQQPPQ